MEESKETQTKRLDLDDVLENELGQFGCFQIKNILLVALPIITTTFMSEYVFNAAVTPHRCRIPECGENSKLHEFEPDWITNAIPTTGSALASCERFETRSGINGTLDYCPVNIFDISITRSCDGYVYAFTNTVIYEFDLGCQDWFRSLAGTLNAMGSLLVLPLTGYISDRFGRKVALILNVFNMGLIGFIRAFSVNHIMYLALQLLQSTLGGAAYGTSYILATEMVGPKYRVITNACIASLFSVGQGTLATVAWLVQPWRLRLMILNIPCFIIISYYWLLPESVRWLLSKNKYVEAKKVLHKVAHDNKTQISDKSLAQLMESTPEDNSSQEPRPSLIKAVLKSPILLRRVCTTPVWWISGTFVYFSLLINSTDLSDTIYLNYILSALIDIPGFFITVLVLDKIGRKIILSFGFFFSASCNIAFIFIPLDLTTLRLVIFLMGKLGIAVVMTSKYLFTAELYPTEFRHTLMGFSALCGSIGAICAPFTPVLTQYWFGLPSLLFGCMGFFSGFLVLTQPETLGTKMPDTLEEAEAIGRKKPNEASI